MSPSKHRIVYKDVLYVVPRVPGTVAFNDLLERITGRGLEIDGGSKLTAMEGQGQTLKAQAKILKMPAASDSASLRRRGAPLPRHNH